MNSPIALEPPPTQAAMASGSTPYRSRHCARASSPMPRVKSRTMLGNGCGPAAVPKRYAVWSTQATQSRSASLMASLSVALPESTGDHLGAEQVHPGDVERLAAGVDRAHVDGAVEPEVRRRGRAGDAVLAGAGLGDHAGLAHPPGQQRLAEHVADLVGAGVVEVLALEQDPGADLLARAARRGRAGSAGRRTRADASNSATKAGSAIASCQATVSSSRAATSASGMKRPPHGAAEPAVLVGVVAGRPLMLVVMPALLSWRDGGLGVAVLDQRLAHEHRRGRPARRSARTSSGPVMPDSATFTTSSGSSGASRPKVSRSTSSVLRLRALTPTSSAPSATARSVSASSCTSTSDGQAELAGLVVQAPAGRRRRARRRSAAPGRRRRRGPRRSW